MGEPMLQPIPESVRSSAGPVSEEAPVGERLASALTHVVDDVLGSYPTKAAEAAIALVEKTTDVVGGLAHTAGELLSGLFSERSSIASGALSGVLGSPFSASVPLAVLILLLSAVFQGGKLSWCCREPLKLRSALQLAIERPG
jgi:hypothetical protein